MEFAGASLLRWSSVGFQWSSPEAVSAGIEASPGLHRSAAEAAMERRGAPSVMRGAAVG